MVAGYITGWGQMAFVTVRDAGHMVPETRPKRALVLFGGVNLVLPESCCAGSLLALRSASR